MTSLEMDNRGFEKEGRTTPDEVIHAAPPTENQTLPVTNDNSDCPCLESQTDCSCAKAKEESPKVELKTWVKPKGLMLVGLGVALIAWCTIYFTLSGLQLL